jgi:hypothetical protein
LNPLYVDEWPDIGALNAGTTVTDYVDLAAEPQVSKGFFAFDNGTGKVAIPTLTTVSGLISEPLKNISNKLQQAETGSQFTSITFPDNLWDDMLAHPNGAGGAEFYIWDQAIDMFSALGSLEIMLFNFDLFDGPGEWYGSIEMHGYGIIENGSWNTSSWSYEVSGVTVSWDYSTKTMSFSALAGCVLNDYTRSNISDTFAVYSVGDPGGNTEIWEWVDTIYDIGDPAYPRRLVSTTSNTGMLPGHRNDEIGILEDLETGTKDSLVAAINELAARVAALE